MKKNKGLVILTVLLVLLIVGASLLYKNLSEGYQGNLMAQEEADNMTADAKTDTEQKQESSMSQQEDRDNQKTESDSRDADSKQELTMAPTFSVTDAEGNTVNLKDFYGKPIVVNFWASWCGPCKSEMPDFEEAYQTYGNDVHFLMVNMTDGAGETVETAQAYIDEKGYTFPVYFDTMQDAAITYGVTSIPSTFFIDKDGHAVAYAQGAIEKGVLQTGLDMIYIP